MDQQVAIGRKLRGQRILRQEIPLLEIELAQIRDPRGLGQHVGAVAEE